MYAGEISGFTPPKAPVCTDQNQRSVTRRHRVNKPCDLRLRQQTRWLGPLGWQGSAHGWVAVQAPVGSCGLEALTQRGNRLPRGGCGKVLAEHLGDPDSDGSIGDPVQRHVAELRDHLHSHGCLESCPGRAQVVPRSWLGGRAESGSSPRPTRRVSSRPVADRNTLTSPTTLNALRSPRSSASFITTSRSQQPLRDGRRETRRLSSYISWTTISTARGTVDRTRPERTHLCGSANRAFANFCACMTDLPIASTSPIVPGSSHMASHTAVTP